MHDDILNAAIALGLEWGEHWQAPIQARVVGIYPTLTETQADKLETLSREVQSFAFNLYEDVYANTITRDKAESQMLAKYAFLDSENLTRLYNQGMYYAWHG